MANMQKMLDRGVELPEDLVVWMESPIEPDGSTALNPKPGDVGCQVVMSDSGGRRKWMCGYRCLEGTDACFLHCPAALEAAAHNDRVMDNPMLAMFGVDTRLECVDTNGRVFFKSD